MPIAHEEINSQIDGSKKRLNGLLEIFISDLLSIKEADKIPIYSIKSRIKDSASAYLKTKRKKYNSINELTDLVGVRLLCLFENDLISINSCLLKYLKMKEYNIIEIKVFNYDNQFIEKINDSIQLNKVDENTFKTVNKPGYKSLHYTVSNKIMGDNVTIEIQARTLLQDVWGELEHSLSYKKGAVHPHIKKSFELLARDLETSDKLMSHLKDIFIKEQLADKFLSGSSTPRDYLGYEDDTLPEVFTTRLKSEYSEYNEFGKQIKLRDKQNLQDNVYKFKLLYDSICSKLNGNDYQDYKLNYWIEMEKAFFHFCNKEYDSALSVYQKLKHQYKDKYCISFRIGEILFVNGETSKALIEFDESVCVIIQLDNKYCRNIYVIKLMLALCYWMLGDDYIDIAIENINECKDIYNSNEDYFGGTVYSKTVLYNNYLWYHLAKYAYSKSVFDYDKLINVYDEVADEFRNSQNLSSNTIDTLAWFFYHKYLHTHDINDLSQSLVYCNMIKSSPAYSTYNYLSLHVQMNHMKEIVSAAAEAGISA